ncbi:RnfABCDGE type electron transport complex subunit D [Ilyobacter polytropus]|uniref:Ion-translocating oxidoreductase complex subunit D n=1 Tax=Ilyobacter polytropus (strain ATCC 51220 / DSM 2926 / LMG 16218 / CuHBu1) TaxID=572544 RepID=E3H6B2_ILYPC|nr:RnfABCDGE type electron transport complex subunit D [Ilyobacter polytropus]ADO82325.1 electron transport complex, RnfABCDGE type, D subunit [Ilyobacter polytropus DSM 2926]
MDYKLSASPHVRKKDTLEMVMYDVVIALLPCMASAVYYFGWEAVKIMLVAVTSGLITEAILARLMEKSWKCILDGSGLVTALLLALIVPHLTPLWMVALGSIFGIGVGKMAYGGVGENIFNPALVGRIFMMISFPSTLYKFHTADGLAGATAFPLVKYMGADWLASNVGGKAELYKNLFTGKEILGSMGEINKGAILVGFLYLGFRKRLKWRVPLVVVLTSGLLSYLNGEDPIISILSGGLIFGAVYMCTDMVSGPVTENGKAVFAIFVGTCAFFIRKYTSHPVGIGYAILLGNVIAPLINKYTEPRVYGKDRNMKKIYGILSVVILFIAGIFMLTSLDKINQKRKEAREEKIMSQVKSYIFQKDLRYDDEEGIYYEGYVFIPAYDEYENRYYLVLGEARGYGSKMIKFAMGITPDKKIAGVRILEASETEGLGAKITDEKWMEHWRGMDSDYKFDKEKDAAAGATYTYKNIHKTFNDVLVKSKNLSKDDSQEEEEELDGEGGATDTEGWGEEETETRDTQMSETEELDGEGGATDTEGWGEEETETQDTQISETQDGEGGATDSDWEEEGDSKW